MGYDESKRHHLLTQQPDSPTSKGTTITCYLHPDRPSQDCAVCMNTSTPKDCPMPMTTANYHKIIEQSDELLHEALAKISYYKRRVNKLEGRITRLTHQLDVPRIPYK